MQPESLKVICTVRYGSTPPQEFALGVNSEEFKSTRLFRRALDVLLGTVARKAIEAMYGDQAGVERCIKCEDVIVSPGKQERFYIRTLTGELICERCHHV